MAGILKLRRGNNSELSSITLAQSEPFYNTSKHTLQLGTNGTGDTITLVKLGEINTGSLYLSGDLTASNARLSGDITIGGNIFLGDGVADNIVVSGEFSSSLIPNDNNEYDLGSTSKKWRHLYSVSASIDSISLPGSGIVSQSSQIDHDSTNNFVANEHIDHTSVNISAGDGLTGGGDISSTRTLTLSTGSDHFRDGVKEKLNIETVISQSSQVEIDSVNGFTSFSSSIDTRIDDLEGTFSTSVDLRLDELEATGSDHADRIVVLEGTFSSSVDSRLDELEGTFSSSVDTRIDSLENFSSSQYDTDSSSFDARLDDLETDSASLDSRYEPIASGTNTLISGAAQLDGTTLGDSSEIIASGSFSGSFVGDGTGITGITADNVEFGDILNKPTLVSSSTQIVELLPDGVISGSGQLPDGIISGSGQLPNGIFSGSGQLPDGIVSQSSQIIPLLPDGVISGSGQLPSGIVSQSAQISAFNKFLEINGDGVISQSNQVTIGDVGGFTTYSASVDQKLESIHDYTSSLKTAVNVSGQNLTVYGNLTVQGTQTSLNTNDLIVEDKLIAVASGSTTSAQADGAGLFISGANKSLTWDDTNSNILIDARVSSSVGFVGDGSGLTGISADSVTFANVTNKPTLVSGSEQISGSIFTHVSGDIQITTDGVSTITAGVIANDDISTSAGILHTKLELNGSGIVSGSDQVSGSIYDGVSGDISSSVDGVVTIAAGVIDNDNVSLSANIKHTKIDFNQSNIISSSLQISESIYNDISGDITIDNLGTASIESGVIVNDDISTSAGILHTKINFGGSEIISESNQLHSDFDTRYLNTNGDDVVSGSVLRPNGDDVVSGSVLRPNGDDIVSGSVLRTLNGTNVVSESAQITPLLPDGVVSGSTQITNGSNIVSGSDQVTQSLDLRYLTANGENIVSSSNQVTQSLDLRFEPIANGSNTLISSSVFSSPTQGNLSININGDSSTVNFGLTTNDGPSFQSASFLNLETAGAAITDALFIDTADSDKVKTKALGTAAFLNTSASVGDDPNSVPTNRAVNNALIAAGAGDLTEFNPSNTFDSNDTGLVHLSTGTLIGGVRGVQGNVHIAIDTGSTHFVEGVKESLPDGVVSGSEQLNTVFLEINGDNVVSSSTQTISHLNGTGIISSSTQIDSDLFNIDGLVSSSQQISDFNTFLEINGDGVISGSSQVLNGSGVISGSVLRPNGDGVISGSDQLNTVFLEINGDSVVSGSDQINDLIVGTSFSSSIDSRVVNLESETHENPLTFNDTNTIALNRSTDTITAKAIGGIVSQSAQIIQLLPDGVISGSSQLPSGIVSESVQLDGFVSRSGDFTVNELLVADGTNSVTSSNILSLDTTNNYLGINQSNPEVTLHMTGDGAQTAQIRMEQFNDSADAPDLRTFRARGTSATPADIQTGDYLFRFNAEGRTGGSFTTYGSMQFDVDSTDADAMVWRIESRDSGGTLATRLIVDKDGDFTTTGNIKSEGNISGSSFNGTGLISSSAQIDSLFNIDGLVSTSQQISNFNTFLEINGDSVVSSSAQISGYNTFLEINGDGIVSQSLLNDLTDTEVNQLKNIDSSTISSTQWGYVGNMNQNVRTSDNVTFNNLTVGGNLTVEGSRTELQVNDLIVEDKLIAVASGSADGAAADGGGLFISGAEVSMTWDNGNERLYFNTGSFFSGSVQASGDVVAYASSDERLKNNITKISGPLNKINAINGYTFDWDEEKQNIYKGRDYGVIAQEVERVAPELVDTRDTGYKAVKYEKLVPILIESIKELKREIDELKKSK